MAVAHSIPAPPCTLKTPTFVAAALRSESKTSGRTLLNVVIALISRTFAASVLRSESKTSGRTLLSVAMAHNVGNVLCVEIPHLRCRYPAQRVEDLGQDPVGRGHVPRRVGTVFRV